MASEFALEIVTPEEIFYQDDVMQYSDDQGYRHEAEYDANDRPIADRKYDDKGN